MLNKINFKFLILLSLILSIFFSFAGCKNNFFSKNITKNEKGKQSKVKNNEIDKTTQELVNKIYKNNYMKIINEKNDDLNHNNYFFKEEFFGLTFNYPNKIGEYKFVERFYDNQQGYSDFSKIFVNLEYKNKYNETKNIFFTVFDYSDINENQINEMIAPPFPELCNNPTNSICFSYNIDKNIFDVEYNKLIDKKFVDFNFNLNDSIKNYDPLFKKPSELNEKSFSIIKNNYLKNNFLSKDQILINNTKKIFNSIKFDPSLIKGKPNENELKEIKKDIKKGIYDNYDYFIFNGPFKGINRQKDTKVSTNVYEFIDNINTLKFNYIDKLDKYEFDKRLLTRTLDIPSYSYNINFTYNNTKEKDNFNFNLFFEDYNNNTQDVAKSIIADSLDAHDYCKFNKENNTYECFKYYTSLQKFKMTFYKISKNKVAKISFNLHDNVDFDNDGYKNKSKLKDVITNYIKTNFLNNKFIKDDLLKIEICKKIIISFNI